MHIKFTNLFELIYEKKKILNKVNELIKKSQFVGGEEFVPLRSKLNW